MRRLPLVVSLVVMSVMAAHPAEAGGVAVHEYTLPEVFTGRGFAALVEVESVDGEAWTITGRVEEACSQPDSQRTWQAAQTDTWRIHKPIRSDDPAEWVRTTAHWSAVGLHQVAAGSEVWLVQHLHGSIEILPGDENTGRKLRWFCQEDWEAAYAAQTPTDRLAADLSDLDLREPAWRALASRGVGADVRGRGVIATKDAELIVRLASDLEGVDRTSFLSTLVETWKDGQDRHLYRALLGTLREPTDAMRAELLALFLGALDRSDSRQRGLHAELLRRAGEWLASPEGRLDAARFVPAMLVLAAERSSSDDARVSEFGELLTGADLERWVVGILALVHSSSQARTHRFDALLFDAAATAVGADPRAAWAAPLAAVDCTRSSAWSLVQETLPRHVELLLAVAEAHGTAQVRAPVLERLESYTGDTGVELTDEQRRRIEALR